ncbi:MAG: VWA domain-containing protein [Pyrinomonadaceae bacterium]|nr:VWA domain-containing protein [Pyrinomonadaceae bacterium]
MLKLTRSIPMSLVLVILVVFDATAQDEAVEKIETAIANIPVVVTDSAGRPVSGLAREDFEVSINGKKQPIDFFDDSGAVSIAIVIDAMSNTSEVLDRIKRDAQRFIDHLRPAEHAIVVRLDMGYKVLTDWTSDRKKLRRAVGMIDSHRDRARLMDTVLHQIIYYEMADLKGKKAVVIFGDPDSAIAWYDIKDNELFQPKFLAESDAAVYPIFYQTYTFPRHLVGKTLTFDQLLQIPPMKNYYYYASLTGGRVYAAGAENFKSAFGEILDGVRNQYVLGFYLDEDSTANSRNLTVRTVKQGNLVRTKSAIRPHIRAERQYWTNRLMNHRQR